MSPSMLRELGAAARLDWAELRRSRWLVFCGLAYAALGSVFVLVGLRESSVFGFTGMSRVLFSTCHTLVLLLPLFALTATTQVVNRARDDGTLELLFTLPLRRSAWFAGVSLTRYLALVAPLAVTMVALGLVGRLAFGQSVEWAFLARTLFVCATLLAAFTGLGLLISTAVRSPTKAMLWALFAWAAGVALLDFGLIGVLLRMRLQPATVLLVGALNPVQAARLALVSGAQPDLALLGPVGAWVSTHFGPGGLLGIGIVVPLTVALVSWITALRLFRRGDLV